MAEAQVVLPTPPLPPTMISLTFLSRISVRPTSHQSFELSLTLVLALGRTSDARNLLFHAQRREKNGRKAALSATFLPAPPDTRRGAGRAETRHRGIRPQNKVFPRRSGVRQAHILRNGYATRKRSSSPWISPAALLATQAPKE